ncbi:paraquat-inducible protein A [Glaciecola sp. SC05]|uniref:paraquat-inducible protein A n=1 Tax=Glaciecola sp. SC05 TaxID=1987355 RepID=UPI0035286D2E
MDLNKHIACHHCDLLIRLPDELEVYQKVCCPRCFSEQFVIRKNPLDKTIAIALCALVLLGLSISFPFLSIETAGSINTISLLQSPLALYDEGYSMIALLVLACVILLPAIYLLSLLAMLFPVYVFGKNQASVFYAKIVTALLPWIMADVFVIGVLVALIKLMDTAEIVLDIAFWSYIAFTVMFIIITNIVSKRQLWYWVENGK